MRLEAGRLVAGTFWVISSRVIEGAVALVFSILVARALGEDYGFVGAAMAIFGILDVLSRLGIPQANTRYVAHLSARGENRAARSAAARTLVLESALAMGVAVLVLLGHEWLAVDVFGKPGLETPLLIVSPMLFFAGVGGVWLSTLQGLHRYRAFSLLVSVNPLVRLGTAAAFIGLGWGVEGAMLGYMVGHLVAMLLGGVLAAVHMQRDLAPEASEVEDAEGVPSYPSLFKFGSVVTLGTMAAVVFEWTDKLMLTAWRPIEDVAFYTIAFGMVSLPLLIPRSVNKTFYPMVSTLHGEGRREALAQATQRVVRFSMLLMAFVPVAMMAIAPWVVGLLYGELFLPAVAPFLILSVWGLVRPVGLLAYSIPKGMGRPMVGAGAMVLTAVLNVVLNALLIPPMGTVGAALATTASYLVGFSYLTAVALRMVGADFPWASVARSVYSAVMAGGVMLLAYVFLSPLVDPAGATLPLVAAVVGTGLAGLGLYVLLTGLLGTVSREDVEFVRGLGVPGASVVGSLLDRVARLRGR